MHLRNVLGVAVISFSVSAGSAAAQRQSLSASSAPGRFEGAARPSAVLTPRDSNSGVVQYAQSARSSSGLGLGPIKVSREQNAFQRGERVQLTTLWGGRVQVACLHRHVRNVHTHSAVPIPDQEALGRRNWEKLPGQQVSEEWGGGIWLYFGRRNS